MQKIVLSMIALLTMSSFQTVSFAGTSSANTQSTATIASTCTITAQNLNFGALVLPLSAQNASTSMAVLCSNKASYTVGLAYGGQWYCTYSGTINGQSYTIPQDNIGGCPSTIQAQVASSYAYGKMIGTAKGDSIGYSIQVPGNPGKVWNNGQGNYTATGTGVSQTIPVVGTLVPAQSGSSYPTPDTYMDTVTATVNF